MKNPRIIVRALSIALIAVATAGITASAIAATAKKTAKQAEPPKPAGQVVEYSELENRIGQTLVIDTTFKTTRQGKLIKYTQPALTLDIGSQSQPTEFTVPRETIKTITVLTPADPPAPAAEPAKDTGTSGAKKN